MSLQQKLKKLLETESVGDIINELHNIVTAPSKHQGRVYEEFMRETSFILGIEGYKVYKNLSLFQGEQVDEFVCQLFPYHHDQQMVIC